MSRFGRNQLLIENESESDATSEVLRSISSIEAILCDSCPYFYRGFLTKSKWLKYGVNDAYHYDVDFQMPTIMMSTFKCQLSIANHLPVNLPNVHDVSGWLDSFSVIDKIEVFVQ